jgi:hypothetical protein
MMVVVIVVAAAAAAAELIKLCLNLLKKPLLQNILWTSGWWIPHFLMADC